MANDKVVELLKLRADKNKNRVGQMELFKKLVTVVVILSVLMAFIQNKNNEINIQIFKIIREKQYSPLTYHISFFFYLFFIFFLIRKLTMSVK